MNDWIKVAVLGVITLIVFLIFGGVAGIIPALFVVLAVAPYFIEQDTGVYLWMYGWPLLIGVALLCGG